jgi:hypothetical protein
MDSMELAMFRMPKADPFGIAIMGLGVLVIAMLMLAF